MTTYSTYHFRIKTIRTNPGYTWIFLPGGPGLGSEYLESLCHSLKVPGTVLLVDFPKDGTNHEGLLNFSYWKKGLIELLSTYNNPVLVTHSFAGMFALDTPELEPLLTGLVLMNTTTSNTFFEHVSAMQQQHSLPDLVPPAAQYHLNPSNDTYRHFWNTYKHYYFTPKELTLGEQMLSLFAFNNHSYHYAIEHFYAEYHYRWLPSIPTLTIASQYDFICPPSVFTAAEPFQKNQIINKIILQAGHCPWLVEMSQLQQSFNELVHKITAG
jgi:pimeloyl-ACP methyl ester carboxylesterase